MALIVYQKIVKIAKNKKSVPPLQKKKTRTRNYKYFLLPCPKSFVIIIVTQWIILYICKMRFYSYYQIPLEDTADILFREELEKRSCGGHETRF